MHWTTSPPIEANLSKIANRESVKRGLSVAFSVHKVSEVSKAGVSPPEGFAQEFDQCLGVRHSPPGSGGVTATVKSLDWSGRGG